MKAHPVSRLYGNYCLICPWITKRSLCFPVSDEESSPIATLYRLMWPPLSRCHPIIPICPTYIQNLYIVVCMGNVYVCATLYRYTAYFQPDLCVYNCIVPDRNTLLLLQPLSHSLSLYPPLHWCTLRLNDTQHLPEAVGEWRCTTPLTDVPSR